MSTKLTRKEKIALQKESGAFSPKEIKNQENQQRSLKNWLAIVLAALAFIMYVSTVGHDYVLDDFGLIKENSQTKKGISAIPEIFKSSYRFGMNITDYTLYRPLTKAMFAAEWQMSPDKPALSHWINVLLFALTAVVLFKTLSKFMNGQLILPFLTTILFIAHPIHAEVVSNIKSRDEIVTLLLCLLSASAFYDWIKEDKTSKFIIAVSCYMISLFAKESTITFMAAIPLIFYYFTEAKQKHYTRSISAMAFCTVIFLLIRRKILSGVETEVPMIDNYIAGLPNFFIQRVNAIYMLGYYVKTLIVPYPLIADGSYNHFKAVTITDWKFLLSAIGLGAALVYAFIKMKQKDLLAFGILFFFITASVASNIFMLIGTAYGERLMYIPSLGFCFAIAYLITKLFKSDLSDRIFNSWNTFFNTFKTPIITTVSIALLFSIQAYSRSMEWKNDYTLYSTDVKKTPDSAHMLFYYANHITKDEYFATLPDSNAIKAAEQEGVDVLTRAVTVYPEYADGYQRRAYILKQMGKDSLSELDYLQSLKYNWTNPVTNNNYGFLLFNARRYEEAKKYFEIAVKYNPHYAHALNNLASTYGVYGQGSLEAANREPANAAKHRADAQSNFQTAIGYFLKAIDEDPEFLDPIRLVAITYRNTGDITNADKYDALASKVARQKKNAKN